MAGGQGGPGRPGARAAAGAGGTRTLVLTAADTERRERDRRAAVRSMLEARSVAVVGASPRPGSFGERLVVEARRSSARFHLVNPRYAEIDGLPCVPSVTDVEDELDLVLLGVPDAALTGQLESAAAVGARSAVVFGSAHGEGSRGRIADVAASNGMAVCGAGCMGFVNPVSGVRALGYLEPDPLPAGPVTLVTHSGSAFSTLLRARRGFGFRLAVSSGQELVTDTADYIEYALADPGTRVIALLLETPRGGSRLLSSLRRAADADVPVVLLAVGGSPPGAAMVAAHSGAVAGDDAAWEALGRATGALRVRDMAEFTDTLEVLSAGRRARPGRHGVATVHDSGAERTLLVDLAHELGVCLSPLHEATQAALTSILDDGLEATNPLDLWGTGHDTRALFRASLTAMTEDPGVAVTALAVDLVTEYDGDTDYPDAVLDVAAATDAPLAVLASTPSAVDPATAGRLRAAGVPVLEGFRSGLVALGHLASLPPSPARATYACEPARRDRWRTRLASPTPWTSDEGFRLLADYDVPVVATHPADDLDAALAAADAVGYPVALKTAAVAHKTDVGGVVLGVPDGAGLRSAYDDLASRLGPAVTVSAMAPPGVEVALGISHDAHLGPLVVVAAGGALVELVADRAVALPPLSAATAYELLDGLRLRRLLDGVRGAAPVDVGAVVDAIVALSTLAADLGDHLAALDVNPLVAHPAGAVAVDVLVVPRQKIA